MTTTVPDALLAALDALKRRAETDPSIATSSTRASRIGTVVSLLLRAAPDCDPAQLRDLQTLLAPDTIGHPDQPDSILGRAIDGRYRTRPPYEPLKTATQRYLMDGLADLNRAAGQPPYWWQAWGKKPWTKHTKQPITVTEHTVLRRALTEPATHPRWEPFRLRNLAVVELLWATGVPSDGLVQCDVTDLGEDHRTVTLTINLPGRTDPWQETLPLTDNARTALRMWLPARRAVIEEHLSAGPDAPANQALFITLHPTTADLDDGSFRVIPPGIRISAQGLEISYSTWARRLNGENRGQKGWPVPTTLQQLSRGGAVARGYEPAVGRRTAMTPETTAEARARLRGGETLVSIAASLGVSRPTLYTALKGEGTDAS